MRTRRSGRCARKPESAEEQHRPPRVPGPRTVARLAFRPASPLRCAQRSPPKAGAEALGPHDYESWALFCWSDTRRKQDEVQARVHLARRLRARPEPTQQDEDRRLRDGADARPAAALELRRQLDAPGGRLELGLLPAAGRALPRPGAQPRPPRHVRGAAARRDAASVEQPRRDPRTTPTPGSASSRSTSSTRTARRSGSRRRASPRRRASTTPASASRTSATSRGRSSTSTSTSASRPASRSRA